MKIKNKTKSDLIPAIYVLEQIRKLMCGIENLVLCLNDKTL